MKNKFTCSIIFIALLIAFTSVAVAADVDSGDTAGVVSASVAANDVAQTVDVPVSVSDNGNDNKIIKNTQSDVKTENSPSPEIHNLNDSNFDEIITSTGLNGVNDGDVLNLTCDITRSNNSYLIDKAVSFEGNGTCPNCQPNNNNTLLKKSNQQLKTEASEILYQDGSCVVYNNGTAILKITKDNQRCLALGETNSHLNEYELTNIIVYVNEINYNSYPGYPYFNVNLGSNKENIDLKIVWNMTRNTHSQGFELRNFGYKSVTYENCKFYIKPIDEDGDNIYSWPIFSNVNVINSEFTYIATEDLFDYFNPNSGSYYFTELHYYTDPEHQTGGSDPGASINMFHIIGENNLFEGCTFELTTMQQDWDYKTYNNIIVFNNASNVTFNNNSFTITSMESDSSITPDNYAPLLNRTVNNLTFTNNDISIRYAQGIKLKTNNSLFENNTITVQHADNTIELTGDNNVVRYNTLTAGENEGDATVITTGTGNIVRDNPYVEVVDPVLKVDTVEFVAGSTSNIQASIYLGDDVASDVNKGKVTFKVNGKTLKDANGKTIYTKVTGGVAVIDDYLIPESWAKDAVTIEAVYSGSADIAKLSSGKVNLTVTSAQAEEPSITTSNVSAAAGETITLSATITDNGKVINSGKVVFKINGKTVKDANGKVIYAKVVDNQVGFEYTLPESMKAREYNITAVYTGNDYRLEDTKTLTVN